MRAAAWASRPGLMAGSIRNTAWAAVNVRPAAPPAHPEQDQVKQETTPPQRHALQHLTRLRLACPLEIRILTSWMLT